MQEGSYVVLVTPLVAEHNKNSTSESRNESRSGRAQILAERDQKLNKRN
jgi:hypothetical protein